MKHLTKLQQKGYTLWYTHFLKSQNGARQQLPYLFTVFTACRACNAALCVKRCELWQNAPVRPFVRLSCYIYMYTTQIYTLCLKKVPTFKLSVTLSNLNRFSKFCIAGKCMKFATKHIRQYPLHLRHVATLPWEIKHLNFLQIFSRYGRNANKLHLNCLSLCYSSTNFDIFGV